MRRPHRRHHPSPQKTRRPGQQRRLVPPRHPRTNHHATLGRSAERKSPQRLLLLQILCAVHAPSPLRQHHQHGFHLRHPKPPQPDSLRSRKRRPSRAHPHSGRRPRARSHPRQLRNPRLGFHRRRASHPKRGRPHGRRPAQSRRKIRPPPP